jgi:hypothetical protein
MKLTVLGYIVPQRHLSADKWAATPSELYQLQEVLIKNCFVLLLTGNLIKV